MTCTCPKELGYSDTVGASSVIKIKNPHAWHEGL